MLLLRTGPIERPVARAAPWYTATGLPVSSTATLTNRLRACIEGRRFRCGLRLATAARPKGSLALTTPGRADNSNNADNAATKATLRLTTFPFLLDRCPPG